MPIVLLYLIWIPLTLSGRLGAPGEEGPDVDPGDRQSTRGAVSTGRVPSLLELSMQVAHNPMLACVTDEGADRPQTLFSALSPQIPDGPSGSVSSFAGVVAGTGVSLLSDCLAFTGGGEGPYSRLDEDMERGTSSPENEAGSGLSCRVEQMVDGQQSDSLLGMKVNHNYGRSSASTSPTTRDPIGVSAPISSPYSGSYQSAVVGEVAAGAQEGGMGGEQKMKDHQDREQEGER